MDEKSIQIKKKTLITSIAINSVIIFLVILGMIFSFTRFYFMGESGKLTPDDSNLFTFFTVDSNLLLALFSVPLLIYEILIVLKKREDIPTFAYILKIVGTVGTSLTLFTVLFYLCPLLGSQFWKLFMNTNLFFHLIVPVLGIVSFIFFEYQKEIDFRFTFVGIIPMLIYGTYYTINALSHMEGGSIDSKYDVYGFTAKGLGVTFIVMIGMIGFTYLLSFLLYFFNKKIHNKNVD